MADHQEASLTLPSAPESVPTARRYVTGVLAEWGDTEAPDRAELLGTVQLIVSELATNAVVHTFGRSPSFTVVLRLDRHELLRIGVTDGHPRMPRRLPAAVQQDNGRGLIIIRSLVAESGGKITVVPTGDGGKTVWAELPWPGQVVPLAPRHAEE
ncbi:ATP-binding protein [Streptomyces sp. Ru73]|uniref:ATP-binding protein n=1 Tax=Streptomyces sp. Ru73 TaxID=2080748 RepID=UPI000CDE3F2D|nr:ATP-binding protein [Streptomyces sp. Ru73]POX38157.1 ATP-binding protein [Streptomyces sp. Ru73]